MSAATGAIKFLREKCGFGCGDPGSEISLAWKAIEEQSAAYDALVAGVRDLAAGWSYETANFVHGTNCAENRAMCAQKAACADDLSRLLVREGGDA